MEKINHDDDYLLQKAAMFFSVLGDTGRIKDHKNTQRRRNVRQ